MQTRVCFLTASHCPRTRVRILFNSKYNNNNFFRVKFFLRIIRPISSKRSKHSGALKAQYDQANKEYKGNSKFSHFSVTLLKYLTSVILFYEILLPIPNVLLLDLPVSTPLIDLSKMAALDMGKLLQVEESCERCIRRIQEFIINELSSSEAAVLPEDKLQQLVVRVCNFLQPSNELEFASFCLSYI